MRALARDIRREVRPARQRVGVREVGGRRHDHGVEQGDAREALRLARASRSTGRSRRSCVRHRARRAARRAPRRSAAASADRSSANWSHPYGSGGAGFSESPWPRASKPITWKRARSRPASTPSTSAQKPFACASSASGPSPPQSTTSSSMPREGRRTRRRRIWISESRRGIVPDRPRFDPGAAARQNRSARGRRRDAVGGNDEGRSAARGEAAALDRGRPDSKPGPHEVLIRTVAAGVCHSDLHFQKGSYMYPMPAVLGHESAGVVEQVGSRGALRRAGRPRDHLPVGVLRALRVLPLGPAGAVHEGRHAPQADRPAAALEGRHADAGSSSTCRRTRSRCSCTRTRS